MKLGWQNLPQSIWKTNWQNCRSIYDSHSSIFISVMTQIFLLEFHMPNTLTYFLISWLAINKWRGFLPVPENIQSIQNYDLRGIIHEFKNFNSISLLPRVTRFGQPMDTFRRLGAPTPISLNNKNNDNNNNIQIKAPISIFL